MRIQVSFSIKIHIKNNLGRFVFLCIMIFLVACSAAPIQHNDNVNRDELLLWRSQLDQAKQAVEQVEPNAALVSVNVYFDLPDLENRWITCIFATDTGSSLYVDISNDLRSPVIRSSQIPLLAPGLPMKVYQEWGEIIYQSRISPEDVVRMARSAQEESAQSEAIHLSIFGYPEFQEQYGTSVVWVVTRVSEGIAIKTVIDPDAGIVLK